MTDATVADERRLGRVDTSFYLIGVGASAGGLEAIRAFLGPVPEDCRHSFVLIQHLSPDYKSLMGDLLRRETSLPIKEVEKNLIVEPGHIYLIPPRANVIIQGTHPGANSSGNNAENVERSQEWLRFSLIDQPPRPQMNLPIDLFFQSLAEAAGNRAVAVVLSGTGSDGSRGLRAVKDVDGIVMTQSPETAKFDGMPLAAAATKIIDLVLPPDEMVSELLRYFDMREQGLGDIDHLFTGKEEGFQAILDAAGKEAEIDFHRYKEPTLKRRIARRMAIKQSHTVEGYLSYLQRDHAEAAVLCREFLVGVTHFFRDLPAWESLEQNVFPALVNELRGDEPIKIWSAACSTGEEAYTIAMLLDRYLKTNGRDIEFRVLATDINEDALAVARQGIYPAEAMEDVPADYADIYFHYERGGVVINDDLRQRVLFSEHDATEHAPFSRTDLVICRNMLIYMTPIVQSKILASFSFSLKTNAFLFLGASENIERSVSRYTPVNARWRIYKNIANKSARSGRKDGVQFHMPNFNWLPNRRQPLKGTPELQVDLALIKEVLDSLDSCVLLVDERLHIVETFGNYRNFLSLPEDSFSARLLDLLPKPLGNAVSLTVRKAADGEPADHGPVSYGDGGQKISVRIHCRALPNEPGPAAFLIALSHQISSREERLPADPGAEGDHLPRQTL